MQDTATRGTAEQVNEHGDRFGAWLSVQKDREGLVGMLIASLKADCGEVRPAADEWYRAWRQSELTDAAAHHWSLRWENAIVWGAFALPSL